MSCWPLTRRCSHCAHRHPLLSRASHRASRFTSCSATHRLPHRSPSSRTRTAPDGAACSTPLGAAAEGMQYCPGEYGGGTHPLGSLGPAPSVGPYGAAANGAAANDAAAALLTDLALASHAHPHPSLLVPAAGEAAPQPGQHPLHSISAPAPAAAPPPPPPPPPRFFCPHTCSPECPQRAVGQADRANFFKHVQPKHHPLCSDACAYHR